MKERTWSPRKLDVGAFIDDGGQLEGRVPVAALSRLARGLAQGLDLDSMAPVRWSAQGRLLAQRVGPPQRWLDVHASGVLPWECQRCLQPVFLPISVDQQLRFVADEGLAATLDSDSDEDVLALDRQFDLLALVEDELIMAQPMVPFHDSCPQDMSPLMRSAAVSPQGQQLPQTSGVSAGPSAGKEDELSERPNPFAVLAQLKKDGGS